MSTPLFFAELRCIRKRGEYNRASVHRGGVGLEIKCRNFVFQLGGGGHNINSSLCCVYIIPTYTLCHVCDTVDWKFSAKTPFLCYSDYLLIRNESTLHMREPTENIPLYSYRQFVLKCGTQYRIISQFCIAYL